MLLVLYFINVIHLVVSFNLNNAYEETFVYVYLSRNKLNLFFLWYISHLAEIKFKKRIL